MYWNYYHFICIYLLCWDLIHLCNNYHYSFVYLYCLIVFLFVCLFVGITPENPYFASRSGLKVEVKPLGVYPLTQSCFFVCLFMRIKPENPSTRLRLPRSKPLWSFLLFCFLSFFLGFRIPNLITGILAMPRFFLLLESTQLAGQLHQERTQMQSCEGTLTEKVPYPMGTKWSKIPHDKVARWDSYGTIR